ncbi:MAG: hypothetical protein JST26_05650 [Bacteroidetes bacterium]|nr:hypothetical protein [Bacteroidota bacterium]
MTTETKEKGKEGSKATTKILLLMSIGFIIDVGQALIVYNAGKGAEAKALGTTYKWKLPGGKELMKTAGLVLVTSVLTGLLVSAAEAMIIGKEKEQVTKA